MTDEPASCRICAERPASGHSAEEANHEHPANSLCIGCLIALVRGTGTAAPAPVPRDDAPDDDEEDDSAPIVRTAIADPVEELVGGERKRAMGFLGSLGGAFPGIKATAAFEADFIDFSEEGLRGGRTTEIVDMAMSLEWRGTEITISGTHRLARSSNAPFAESERKRFSDAVGDLVAETIEEFNYAI